MNGNDSHHADGADRGITQLLLGFGEALGGRLVQACTDKSGRFFRASCNQRSRAISRQRPGRRHVRDRERQSPSRRSRRKAARGSLSRRSPPGTSASSASDTETSAKLTSSVDFRLLARQRSHLAQRHALHVHPRLRHLQDSIGGQHVVIGLLHLQQHLRAGGRNVSFLRRGAKPGGIGQVRCSAEIGDQLAEPDPVAALLARPDVWSCAGRDSRIPVGAGAGQICA